MTLDDYQAKATTTIVSKEDRLQALLQQVLGLGDESGEVLAIFKKWIRDQDADFDRLDTANIAKELGDVLWYVAIVAYELGLSLEDIGAANLDKLRGRKERGVIAGSGDNR